jgi:hypothetical protein
MSPLWIENIVALAIVLGVLYCIRWSLHWLTWPRRWSEDPCSEQEHLANEAWSEHRQEAYDASVRLWSERMNELFSVDPYSRRV